MLICNGGLIDNSLPATWELWPIGGVPIVYGIVVIFQEE
jgi:hypothetical protein